MSYKRLRYNQYFIDTSEDFNHTGKAYSNIEYTAVPYTTYKFEKLLGLHHEINYAIIYDEKRNVIQIHFQKTNGASDWFANIMEFGSRYYDAFGFHGQTLQLQVHHGWGNMYKTIKYTIRAEWGAIHDAHPQAITEVIGWSLGSGQAMLCAQDLNWNYGVKPYVYTYGSVRPFRSYKGNDQLLDEYLQSICEKCYNFANRNDLITYMPPFSGFRMINRKPIGREKITLKRLFNPYLYHTIYDREELYRRKKEGKKG